MKRYLIKKNYLIISMLLFLVGCTNLKSERNVNNVKDKTETTVSDKNEKVSKSSKVKDNKATLSSTIESKYSEKLKVEITAESLMNGYPEWTIQSGITPAVYNEERKAEANRRLIANDMPEDDDFINRNPVITDRETEKQVHAMVGNLDYVPMEANKVINGSMIKE